MANLPIDDGRGPLEKWPWRRSDDFSPAVRWGRCWTIFLATATAGVVATWPLPGDGLWVLVSVAAGVVCFVRAAIADRRDRWPAWRVRNLVAADFRANTSLGTLDPELGRELGLGRADPEAPEGDEFKVDSSILERFRRPIPTTGPTVPWGGTGRHRRGFPTNHSDMDDRLPF